MSEETKAQGEASPLKWARDSRVAYTHVGCIDVAVYADGGFDASCGSDDLPKGIEAAQAAAETKLREMHDALVQHFAPVLRWTADEARLLGCWVLSIGKRDDGLYWWSTMLGDAEGLGSFGMDGDDCESVDEARRAAEAALRALGVVFRVEVE